MGNLKPSLPRSVLRLGSVAAAAFVAALLASGAGEATAHDRNPTMAAGAFDTRSDNFLRTPFHPSPDVARPRYRLRRLARRLQQPVHVTAAPDPHRLYVVQRTGRVRVLVDGS